MCIIACEALSCEILALYSEKAFDLAFLDFRGKSDVYFRVNIEDLVFLKEIQRSAFCEKFSFLEALLVLEEEAQKREGVVLEGGQ